MRLTDSQAPVYDRLTRRATYRGGSLFSLDDDALICGRTNQPFNIAIRQLEELPYDEKSGLPNVPNFLFELFFVSVMAGAFGLFALFSWTRPNRKYIREDWNDFKMLWPRPNRVFFYVSMLIALALAYPALIFVSGLAGPVGKLDWLHIASDIVLGIDYVIYVLLAIMIIAYAGLVVFSKVPRLLHVAVAMGAALAVLGFTLVPGSYSAVFRIPLVSARLDTLSDLTIMCLTSLLLVTEPRGFLMKPFKRLMLIGSVVLMVSVAFISLTTIIESFDVGTMGITAVYSVLGAIISFWIIASAIGACIATEWWDILRDTSIVLVLVSLGIAFQLHVPIDWLQLMFALSAIMSFEYVVLSHFRKGDKQT